ncbi:MAG: hypothetical protein A2339_04120 [Elusimicrobia bacterium RIFOXYB12_FULL_50_12]|nr:MAG: hypothetical protein A2278_06945 [Elusimicrobia bacterium RIFOXYA12_FULL_49_49]OGS16223.1 MAG: hypothetical protein A2251_01240 [Elusimicrobia bacterium RIFOXYA2_FULL_47_53]OGS26577.1 MAG: hypothetical protein A2339_04120 [Elusimicrobia bacterium RIFOXYB12_FULL_50_12]OGS31378.1 MAG: hypothetical protein A2323_09530 [Elusimicrobia bacterium RIFOXYB2_FULL_46_23]
MAAQIESAEKVFQPVFARSVATKQSRRCRRKAKIASLSSGDHNDRTFLRVFNRLNLCYARVSLLNPDFAIECGILRAMPDNTFPA